MSSHCAANLPSAVAVGSANDLDARGCSNVSAPHHSTTQARAYFAPPQAPCRCWRRAIRALREPRQKSMPRVAYLIRKTSSNQTLPGAIQLMHQCHKATKVAMRHAPNENRRGPHGSGITVTAPSGRMQAAVIQVCGKIGRGGHGNRKSAGAVRQSANWPGGLADIQ